MHVRKTGELAEPGNDLYVVLKVGNRLVINQNDEALKVLDQDLRVQARVPLPETGLYWSCKTDQSGLVYLYDADESLVVVCSVADGTVRVLSLPDDAILAPLHYWTGSSMIVATYGGRGFRVIDRDSVRIMPDEEAAACFPDFAHLVESVAGFGILGVDESLDLFYQEPPRVVWHNGVTGEWRSFGQQGSEAHQAVSDGRYLVLLREDELQVQPLSGGEVTRVRAEVQRTFAQAAFVGPGRLVVASSAKSNHRMSYLEQYELVPE